MTYVDSAGFTVGIDRNREWYKKQTMNNEKNNIRQRVNNIRQPENNIRQGKNKPQKSRSGTFFPENAVNSASYALFASTSANIGGPKGGGMEKGKGKRENEK